VWVAISKFVVAVVVPNTALVAVLTVVAVGVAAIVGGGMAVKWRGLRGRMRGWRLGWGVVGRSGSVCHHFQGAGVWFEAGDRVVETVGVIC